jgi:amidase
VFVDFLADNIRAGHHLSGRDVMRAYSEITRLTRAAEAFFADYDLLVAPVAEVAPFPVHINWPKQVDGVAMTDYLDWMRAAWLFTPLGIPGLSLPAGFTPEGLPVGVQMLAGAGNDVGLLRSALALEHALALPVTTPPEGALTA